MARSSVITVLLWGACALFATITIDNVAAAFFPNVGKGSVVVGPALCVSTLNVSTTQAANCQVNSMTPLSQYYGINSDFVQEWWYYAGNGITTNNQRIGFMFVVSRQLDQYVTAFTVMGADVKVPTKYTQSFMFSDRIKANQSEHGDFSISLGDPIGNVASISHSFERKSLDLSGSIANLLIPETAHIKVNVSAIVMKNPIGQCMNGYCLGTYYWTQSRSVIKLGSTITVNGNTIRFAEGTVYHDHQLMEDLVLPFPVPTGYNSASSSSLSSSSSSSSSSSLSSSVPLARLFSGLRAAESAVGWDFVHMVFDSGVEIITYQMRTSNKFPAHYICGTLGFVGNETYVTSTLNGTVRMTPLGWMRVLSGIYYPSSFFIEINHPDLPLTKYYVAPIEKESEFMPYWFEGAGNAYADAEMTKRIGWGFIEMTRYSTKKPSDVRNAMQQYLAKRLQGSSPLFP